MANEERSNFFIAVAYPESINPRFRDILDDSCVDVAYILHDSDVDYVSDVGEVILKKPHYHFCFSFDSLKSVRQVSRWLYSLGLEKGFAGYSPDSKDICNIVRIPMQPSRCVQYLTHKNHPAKFQYSIEDVVTLGCFDFENLYNKVTSSADDISVIDAIYNLVTDNHIFYYSDLWAFLSSSDEPLYTDYKEFLNRNSFIVKEIIRSKAEKRKFENASMRGGGSTTTEPLYNQ